PASLDALVFLAREQALPPIPPIGGNAPLSLESTPAPSPTPAAPPSVAGGVDAGPTPPPTPPTQSGDAVTLNLAATPPPAPAGATMGLLEVANALENHPDARPYHKLLAIELRARHDPILTDQYVADAVQRFGNAARLAQTYDGGTQFADETLAALAGWFNKIGRPAKTLE